jgi:UDP-N-acetyl-D-glucosamine 4,6-dehydratase
MNIVITGISGTVGRAFVDELKDKHNIAGIDHNEDSVAKFRHDYPDISVRVGDFTDIDFVHNDVDVLIHLAAMKHIDLCETNPNECVMNNIIKTHYLFRNAYDHKVDILFMSTDKAVEPTSVYGYSKAIVESMALEYGGAFIRSGNILASNGSVLKIWDDAIKELKPVKVTHKDMERYFIHADSFAKRAWEQYSKGKKVIIPKMDMHIKLMDLLEDKLASYEYTLETYPGGIVYTGLRPGEKLKEKLDWDE